MTKVTYEDGVLRIVQGKDMVGFRPCDLRYDDRMELTRAISDIAPPQNAGGVGFLKDQPVEERKNALEEALGVSFPLTVGEEIGDGGSTTIIVTSGQRKEVDETLVRIIELMRGD